MPAKSKSQRRLMGACEHGAKLDSCPKGMSKAQMHDYAATKDKGLPEHKPRGESIKQFVARRNRQAK